VTHEKDTIYGTAARRTLAYTRTYETKPVETEYRTVHGHPVAPSAYPSVEPGAFGPEAHGRAQEMSYELTTRIQRESPYIHEEIVEHVVHDQRLLVGIWSTAGVGAVATFLTFSLPCLLVTVVALAFALYASPGRQTRRFDDTQVLD
jgi:hypothetical protein